MPKIKITRQVVIISLFILLAFGAGIVSSIAWSNEVVRAQTTAKIQQAANDYKAKKQAERDTAAKAAFKAECDISVANYNKLTVVQKKTAAAPTCQNLEIVQ